PRPPPMPFAPILVADHCVFARMRTYLPRIAATRRAMLACAKNGNAGATLWSLPRFGRIRGRVENLPIMSLDAVKDRNPHQPARFVQRGLIALAMSVSIAGCQVLGGDESAFRPSANPVTVDTVTRGDRLATLAREQHPRILATYGGEYSDPKLERMVARVVGSL